MGDKNNSVVGDILRDCLPKKSALPAGCHFSRNKLSKIENFADQQSNCFHVVG